MTISQINPQPENVVASIILLCHRHGIFADVQMPEVTDISQGSITMLGIRFYLILSVFRVFWNLTLSGKNQSAAGKCSPISGKVIKINDGFVIRFTFIDKTLNLLSKFIK